MCVAINCCFGVCARREGDGIIRAFAQYTNSDKYPRFNLTFHNLAGPAAPRSVDMKLIATDYDDFALLWGCQEINLFERNGEISSCCAILKFMKFPNSV